MNARAIVHAASKRVGCGVPATTDGSNGVPEARAVVKGAATLDGEWKAVEGATAAEKAAMRFFKVVVEVQ